MRRAIACVVSLVAGCAYRPGSFHSPSRTFAGARATLGCLDLAIERRPDIDIGAVLGYSFGNRCDDPTLVDLASASVVSSTGDGRQERHLPPYDPGHVLASRELDGRAVGGEAIAYLSQAPIDHLCVDAASIVHESEPRWLCFDGAAQPQAVQPQAVQPQAAQEDEP